MKHRVRHFIGILGVPMLWLGLTVVSPAGAIVGGTQPASGEFPFIVQLTAPAFGGFCTASLIHPSWVLTAVHCASGVTPSQLQVRIGNDRTGTGGEVIPIKEIRTNPSYAGGPDDVALLRLQWPAADDEGDTRADEDGHGRVDKVGQENATSSAVKPTSKDARPPRPSGGCSRHRPV